VGRRVLLGRYGEPGANVWFAGESRSVNGGPGSTTSVTVVVCVRLPLTPVTVSVEVPSGVLGPVVTESVEDPVAGFGVKLPLAPLGRPLTLSVSWQGQPPDLLILKL